MTKIDRERRLQVVEQIEQLLADNCRKCPIQRTGRNWGTGCKPGPVCPVLPELQALGKELGFERPARIKNMVTIDEALLRRARENNIPENIYIARVNAGRDPVEAAEMPHFRPRADQDFQRLALSRNIPRTTYGSRVKNGWTPAEAASYAQGAKLKDIREGRARGLYII